MIGCEFEMSMFLKLCANERVFRLLFISLSSRLLSSGLHSLVLFV